jgi:hypothetical protein
MEYVVASEPSVGGGRIRSRGMQGSTSALPSWEAGSRATRHATVSEPLRAGRWGPELLNMW